MNVVLTLAGVALIVLPLRDIFHTLFHPSGGGSLSGRLARAIWWAFRRVGHRRRPALALAGPIAMVVIIAAWGALLAVGWALVLWPRLPEDFLVATGLDPAEQGGFWDALYLSLVTLATLGYGDLTPRVGWLRILAPLEALVGFALMTASISWILSLYPVLGRRRTLARRVVLLREAESRAGVETAATSAASLERVLADLADRVIALQGDFSQFPITYYFRSSDRRSALPVALPEIARLAAAASGPDRPPAVRLQAALLQAAVDDIAAELGRQYLGRSARSPEDLLEAYAADHLYEEERAEG